MELSLDKHVYREKQKGGKNNVFNQKPRENAV